jgi:transcription termination/antitermination protein NusA
MQTQNNELKQAIELLCAERGVTVDDVVAAIESGVAKAYRKDFGGLDKAYEAEYDLLTNTYKIFEIIEVTDQVNEEGDVYNPGKEITLMAARLSDPNAFIGQVYKTQIDDTKLLEFGRVASGIAKQSFEQYIRNIRHSKVLKEYKEKVGELISVEIDYFKKNGYYVKLGNTTAFLGQESLMPNDKFKPGEFIKVCVDSITEDPKLGSKIVLKRNTPEFVMALIRTEIPEVANGQIELLKGVREAGLRTKILVQKEDPQATIDPVGTILGKKEMRIINLMRELNINLQERIDIIEYNEEIDEMIKDALEPARLTSIEHTADTIICHCEKQDAALAVGKRGVNVRLASQLLEVELKILSADKKEEMEKADLEDKQSNDESDDEVVTINTSEETTNPQIVETEENSETEEKPKKTRTKKITEEISDKEAETETVINDEKPKKTRAKKTEDIDSEE